ncbi:MAG: SusC/RagA family protein, partial [Bacteroidales bacterium]
DVRPGDFRFVDINGDGVINDKDRTFIGSPLPKFTYGSFASAYGYGFDFSLSILGTKGNDIFNMTKYYTHGNSNSNYSKELLDAWTPENKDTKIPRIGGDNYAYASSAFLEKGSFMRVKDVVLGYTLPNKLLSKIKVKKIRVYAQAQNLLTITKYSGFDPEIGKNEQLYSKDEQTLELGVDRGSYPQARAFLFGVNLGL